MATASIYKLLHEKLEELKALEIVQNRYDTTEQNMEVAIKELKRLEKQMEKESRDIDKLEGLSVKKLFHKVLGNEESQLEIERQEFLDVSLQYNNHQKSIDLMDFELGVLGNKKKNLPKLQREVARLKKMRESELMKSDTAKGSDLRIVVEEHDSLILGTKEFKEALEVGREILNHLDAIIRYLKQATDWGTWQQSRRNSSYHQQRKIEQARSLLNKTQHLLMLFKKELADVNIRNIDINLDPNSFSGFTNVFFDNLITDWIRQNKIRKTLADVKGTYGSVKQINEYLEKEMIKMNKRMAELGRQREAIIVSR